jgi:hypothetical protein
LTYDTNVITIEVLSNNNTFVVKLNAWWTELLPTFPILKKDRSRFLWLCIARIDCWMPEPIPMKPTTYIMAPQPTPTSYLIKLSQQSLCPYVYSFTVAR